MQTPNSIKTPSMIQRLHWVLNPIGYIESAAQQYPDIFTAKIIGLGDDVVVVNHPQALQEVLSNDRKKFAALGKENRIFQPILGDYSVILLDRDLHKRHRQILMPPFHGERLRSYAEIITNITEEVFSRLPINQPFLARTVMTEISLQVMLQAVFGLYPGERYQYLKQLVVSLLDTIRSPLTTSCLFFSFLQKDFGTWSPWGKFLYQRQQIDEFLYAEIAERRKHPNSNCIDVFSLLMSAIDEQGEPLTDQEIRDEMITLLVAGQESMSSTMAWGLYCTVFF